MQRYIGTAKFLLVGIVVLFLALGVGEVFQYRRACRTVLKNQAARLWTEYFTILRCCRIQADLIFNEAIDREFVLNEFHAAWHADDETERAQHRERLRAHLTPTYENVKQNMFRQLHLHFPDCTSFLRLHRPDKFGDSLAEVRPTVVAANRDRAFVSGFEEGRVFNAYRHVYPVTYRDEHIGTVELSASFAAVGSILKEELAIRSQFVLAKKIVDAKVFSHEKDNYSTWACGDGYVLDTAASDLRLFPGDSPPAAYEKLRDKIQRQLEAEKDFSWIVWDQGQAYVLQFLAIRNYSGEHAAYWVSLQEDPALVAEKRHLQIDLAVLAVLSLLSCIAIFWITRVQRRIREYQSFLPICATCKKVREVGTDSRDRSAWISIEEYFASTSHSQLTHGICPDCYDRCIAEDED